MNEREESDETLVDMLMGATCLHWGALGDKTSRPDTIERWKQWRDERRDKLMARIEHYKCQQPS